MFDSFGICWVLFFESVGSCWILLDGAGGESTESDSPEVGGVHHEERGAFVHLEAEQEDWLYVTFRGKEETRDDADQGERKQQEYGEVHVRP